MAQFIGGFFAIIIMIPLFIIYLAGLFCVGMVLCLPLYYMNLFIIKIYKTIAYNFI